jgi:phage protein D
MTGAWGIAPEVEVDGSVLDRQMNSRLERVTVDQDGRRADMFVLDIYDPARDALQQSHVRIGSKVRIAATAPGGAREQLIEGEVTSLEADFGASGSRLVVRGYDQSHRFTRGARTETYRDVTDSDIARTLAQRAGVDTGRIEDTRVVHRLVSQVGVSDWHFLQARARTVGYVAAVSAGKLDFAPPPDSREAPEPGSPDRQQPLQLVVGADLYSFRPRVSSSGQVGSVEVRGWSAEQKETVVGTAQAETTAAQVSATPRSLSSIFGDQTLVAHDRPYARQEEVDEAARALAERVSSSFAEADGVARGNPALRAGRAVSVAMAGDSFDGKYVLSATRHVFDHQGYRTQLAISGAHDRSLLGLVSAAEPAPRIPGVVTAIVTAVDDPDGGARVKLRLPWLSESYETDWARVAQLNAGGGRGAAFLPEVGDEVLVAFEQGDVRAPYVVGGLYNGVDEPDLGGGVVEGGSVRRRGFKSVAGHQLLFVEGGTTAVELTSSGDVLIKADGKLSIEAQRGVSIDGGGGDVTVKGTTIRLN